MRKTLPDGTVTRYVYGLDGALLAELDSQGVPLKEYIYFNGGLLTVRDLSGGAPRAMTNGSGQVVW